ncbi:MAG: nodulation protein NodZ [Bacteroidia bacterium]
MKEQPKYLVLKGCAGLGNRLYTVCSAIEYSKKTNRTLFVDWSDGQFAGRGVNAFNECFELEAVNTVLSAGPIKAGELTYYPAVWKGQIDKGIYDLYFVTETEKINAIPYKALPKGRMKMLKRYWQFIDDDNKSLKNRKVSHFKGIYGKNNFPFGSDLSGSLTEDVVIFADFSPVYSEQIFLKHVRLKKHIREKITSFSEKNKLAQNTIGIHVRNTDKKPTQSIETLFSKIESLKLKKPQIFLATDNRFVIEQFETKYPGLISYPKFLPEQIKEGLHQYALYNNMEDISIQLFEDSIADMWLLSECEYLLYQSNSSFSIISKTLHVNKQKQFDWLSTNN